MCDFTGATFPNPVIAPLPPTLAAGSRKSEKPPSTKNSGQTSGRDRGYCDLKVGCAVTPATRVSFCIDAHLIGASVSIKHMY